MIPVTVVYLQGTIYMNISTVSHHLWPKGTESGSHTDYDWVGLEHCLPKRRGFTSILGGVSLNTSLNLLFGGIWVMCSAKREMAEPEDGFSTISCICAKTENLTARNKIHTTGIHRHPDSYFHLFTHSHNVQASKEHHSCTDLILSCQLSCPVMPSCRSSCLLRASCLFPS